MGTLDASRLPRRRPDLSLLRIALLLRPDADTRPGGDVVQARAVARHLRDTGADVRELTGWSPDLAGCDLAVVMNLTVPEQAWLHSVACRRAGVRYLLLPVFWDLAAAIPHEQAPTGSGLLPVGSRRRGAAQRLRLAAADPAVLRTAGVRLPGYLAARSRGLVAEVVREAASVLPNSIAERDHLAALVGGAQRPVGGRAAGGGRSAEHAAGRCRS